MDHFALARAAGRRAPWYKHLYVQVLIAIAAGVSLGHFYPHLAKR
jgi:aerobic C4-dicarboxylate transport protein